MRPSRLARSIRQITFGNELGQMSIFLALVFQVLFVFFAMVINIGLLVHDKINLQNSVDLGAYYAAQKQAETLNEIAHLNYQIRQDYKLLAWRYWVLGTLGRDGQGAQKPPSISNIPPIPADEPRIYVAGAGAPPQEEVPVACLANPFWWEFAILSAGKMPNENYCWHPYNWVSPAIPIPSVPMTPATAGANLFAKIFATQSATDFIGSCEGASPLSWAFVAAILTDYKYSIAYKKKAINALRANLVSPNPVDREGKSVREGVINTIQRNLTESNAASFDPARVQILNGLTRGGCDGGNRPGAKTLPEILTAPGLYFALLKPLGLNCTFDIAFQTEYMKVGTTPAAAAAMINKWDPTNDMRNNVSGEPGPDDETHSTLGFEKNPWCMAYVGVKAATSPRKPFAPFGKPVNLEARSFAQPFGGRIGPWYSNRWTRGSDTSNNIMPPAAPGVVLPGARAPMNPEPSQAGRTDPLTSPRLIPGAGGFKYSSYTIPNFSRFPGDRLGMRSKLTQSLARKYFLATVPGAVASAPNFADNRVRLNWFYGFDTMINTGDSLAFDSPAATTTGAIPPQVLDFRQKETAAVAPDLFDITYYSIDPEADANYTTIARNNPAHYGIPGAPVGDLGSRQNVIDMRKYNIQDQIQSANTVGVDPTVMPAVYWLLRDWKNILTGWAPHRAANFQFPVDRFGKCSADALPTAMIPGKCAAGGRTGYSVRLVSREHLQGPWNVGGDGEAPGPLLNAPGDDIEF